MVTNWGVLVNFFLGWYFGTPMFGTLNVGSGLPRDFSGQTMMSVDLSHHTLATNWLYGINIRVPMNKQF